MAPSFSDPGLVIIIDTDDVVSIGARWLNNSQEPGLLAAGETAELKQVTMRL